MVKGLLIALLGGSVLLAGCGGSWSSLGKSGDKSLPDPKAPLRIVQQYFRDNGPGQSGVELVVLGQQRRAIELTMETQLQIAAAVQGDCRAMKSGQDVENIRSTTMVPLASLTLSGPNYALVLYLDSFGLAMGNGGAHRLMNPSLAMLLRKELAARNMMQGRQGQSLDLALRKASNQVSLYQPLPPAMQ